MNTALYRPLCLSLLVLILFCDSIFAFLRFVLVTHCCHALVVPHQMVKLL